MSNKQKKQTIIYSYDALLEILRLYHRLAKMEDLKDWPFSDLEDKIIEMIVLLTTELDCAYDPD